MALKKTVMPGGVTLMLMRRQRRSSQLSSYGSIRAMRPSTGDSSPIGTAGGRRLGTQ